MNTPPGTAAFTPCDPGCGALIYAASEACADLLYASGLAAPDPFLWYAVNGCAAVVVSTLEYGRACKQVKPGVQVFMQEELCRRWSVNSGVRLSPEELIVELARHHDLQQWRVPESFPFGLGRKLETRGLTLDPTPTLFPERSRKSDAEVRNIKTGVAAAEAGLAQAIELLRQAHPDSDGVLRLRGQPVAQALLGPQPVGPAHRKLPSVVEVLSAAGIESEL